MLPTIVAFYVQSFVCVPSLSSPLLLRNYPNTFAFIPIPPMSLSSRNRSNSKSFRHILPCVAPFCKGMHYHKTGVPWHTNTIFTIHTFLLVLFALQSIKLPEFTKYISAYPSNRHSSLSSFQKFP